MPVKRERIPFNVALVQFAAVNDNLELNFERAEGFIADAAKDGAKVIVFPEDFINCSLFGGGLHLDKDNKLRDRFCVLAKKYRIDIVPGSWMEQTERGCENRSTYINAKGEILAIYSKNHLYVSERPRLVPGTEVAVFDTEYGRAGLIICYDLIHPEIFMRMIQQGVEIVYCPSYWWDEIAGPGLAYNPRVEPVDLDAFCITRAVENEITLVYVNAAGKMKRADGTVDHLSGHSQITEPIQGCLVKLSHRHEEMRLQKVDLSWCDMADRTYQLRVPGT